MGRPVKSIGRTWGSSRSTSASSGDTRTIKVDPTSPQHMRLRTMKQMPPNMNFSTRSDRSPRTRRMRCASAASNAIPEF
ncbi:MAG: hypothetical protein R2712_12200 [Vicinamibacterales bacterium]